MRGVTLTCPECRTPEKTVGHPDPDGHNGDFYCFHCRASGSFHVSFVVDEKPAPPATP
jgi:hypothetical protein